MFKFVPDHVGGVGTKRKQVQRSCDQCRKRHKRCDHGESAASPEAQAGPIGGDRQSETPRKEINLIRNALQVPHATERAISTIGQHPLPPVRPQSKEAYLRFVGDLSPEASFLSNERRGDDVSSSSRHAEVGVWLGRRPDQSTVNDHQRDERIEHDESQSQISGLTSLHSIIPQMKKECLAMLPPKYDFDIILSLYRCKVDPLFPILQGDDLEAYAAMDSVALKQCVCLVAALDPKLRRHLRLRHAEHILPPLEFRGHIASAIKQAIDMGFIQDSMVLLQVSALMAFYADQTNCSEVSAHYVSQAVYHAQTLGLHLGWPDDGARTEKSRRIFWCIWILDRLNAAANGRPIIIHHQDMDAQIADTFAEQGPPFKLHIRIVQFLDRVISKYRPQSSDSDDLLLAEDTLFEDMVRETGSVEVSSSILASLEILYLAVVILRYRPQQSERKGQAMPSSDLQLFAATSIIAIASEDFKSTMTYWPAVPYAVSLATSVAYKSLRYSVIAHRRKRAYTMFHSSCELLDEIGKAFCSAKTIARLATNTLQEVERVAADRSKAIQFSSADSPQRNLQRTFAANDTSGRGTKGPSSQAPDGEMTQDATDSFSASFDNAPLRNKSPSIFNDFIGDAGIFDDFDPDFDLNRIDQVFSANLNPTQSIFAQGWFDDLAPL